MYGNLTGSISIDDLLPILDSITDAVFIDDSSGVCIWCNNACEELYKINSYDIEGKHVNELERTGIFTPSVTKRVLEEKRDITIIHENKLGKRLLTTGTPLFDDSGEISLIITTSRDITTLSNLKRQPQLSTGSMIDLGDIDKLDSSGSGIIASSVAMRNVMSLTKRLATVNSTVLITGESGVGKGLIAKLLHEEGNRYKEPFVTVNCGAIPENLIES